MVERCYKSLDEVLTKGVKELITEEPSNFTSIAGMNGYIPDLFINVESIDCTIDLGSYLYTKNKWTQLLNLYVDKERLIDFANILKESKSYSQTFYFKEKPRTVGHGNGSCLISMVVTRPTRNKPFNRAIIMYRTTVLTKQFVCDLVLLNKLATYLNGNTDGKCNITTASLYAPWASVHAFHLALYCKNFKINPSKYPENLICKKANKWLKEFFTGNRVTKYKSFDRLIRYYNQGGIPSIPIEELSIF